LHWRNQKIRFSNLKEIENDWEAEIPKIFEKLKSDRNLLFEDLDFYA